MSFLYSFKTKEHNLEKDPIRKERNTFIITFKIYRTSNNAYFIDLFLENKFNFIDSMNWLGK